ncbi:hypothetical protein GY45DRAFT_553660 [Cubamyces sp. BRFM 1775]|nr:hypothetical protein GY45DRAFT_553660 [Cubamyces sp. BRFM 1775]
MTSATYIPLTQISPSEYTYSYSQDHKPRLHSLRAYFTRRRAVYALVAATSLLTLIVFLRVSSRHVDDLDDLDYYEPVDPNFQPSYIAIPVPDSLPPSAHPRLRPVRDLPGHCLDAYFSSGELCHDSLGPVPMDVLWTWVNGSDPLFADAKERAAASFADDDPYRPIKKNNPSRMFRDHDELRHSVRSVLANYRPYTNRFRILTSDFDYPEKGAINRSFHAPSSGYWRLGLQPQWLETSDNLTEWRDGNVELSLTHHAHFFEPYNHSIFNSYAIESQFSHLQDVSEIFIYMNDDFYMTAPLTPASFYTSPYGIVFRLQSGLQVAPGRPGPEVQGEWRSMGESNALLSDRFGARRRPYVVHEAKAVSFAILQELALVWPEELAETGSHAFRETEAGKGDFYQMFIHAHYIIERAREALLWTWIVGRIGKLDDTWGPEEAERAWRELGGSDSEETRDQVHVHANPRETLVKERILKNLQEAGYDTKNIHTEYEFSSLDGFPYGHFQQKGEHGWGSYGVDDARPDCVIKRDTCFNAQGRDGNPPTASDVFKHIAFRRPDCGDCAIVALVKASGPLGISAFLPSEERRVPLDGDMEPAGFVPHLPLVKNYRNANFAVQEVMKNAHTTSVREWSLMVLQRYRYVIGGTPSIFERLLNYNQVRGALSNIDKRKDLALLCINDDLAQDDPRIAKMFSDWQEQKWPHRAAWEADHR